MLREGARFGAMHGCGSQFAMVAGWNIVAGNVKKVGDRAMDGNETLKMSC